MQKMHDIDNALLDQARQQFELSQRLCHAECRDYHAAWPLLRLAKLVGGIDADRVPLFELIGPVLQRPGLRVLIAGCADSAQLDLLRELSGANAPAITVIDRCATPLAACAAGQLHNGSTTVLRQSSLLEFDPALPFDLILCHSLLPFLAKAERSRLLSQFSRWLGHGGRLVLAVKLDPALDNPDVAGALTISESDQWVETRTLRASGVLDEIPQLQDAGKAARLSALRGFYSFMASKPTPYASAQQLVSECVDAGLKVRQRRTGGIGQGYPGKPTLVTGLASVLLELSAVPDTV
jgi:SAM-dependent methyltransferase